MEDILFNLIFMSMISIMLFFIVVDLWKKKSRKEMQINTRYGINELRRVYLNGTKQWLYIRGNNKNNPVLLILHGGPGNSLMPVSHLFQSELETIYTVCQYDQRFAGKSYSSSRSTNVAPTLNIMLDDCLHITMYLKEYLNTDKITLMCHSWGTVLGTTLVSHYPKHYVAYIGIGQVCNFIENERLCYEKMLSYAKLKKRKIAILELESIYPYPDNGNTPAEKAMIMRRWSSKYNLFYSKYTGIKGILNMLYEVLRSPAYSIKDTTSYLHNIFDIFKSVFEEDLKNYDIMNNVIEYKVPMYLISGDNDWVTPHILAEQFAKGLDAPDKDFYLIHDAGHSPMLDQTEEFWDIMKNKIYPRIFH